MENYKSHCKNISIEQIKNDGYNIYNHWSHISRKVAKTMFKEFAITIKGVPDEGVTRRFWKEIESDYYAFMRLHAHAIIYGEAPSETIDWLVIKCRKFGFEVIEVTK